MEFRVKSKANEVYDSFSCDVCGEARKHSWIILKNFRVNTMFACRCSEMIYYSCNMSSSTATFCCSSENFAPQSIDVVLLRVSSVLLQKSSHTAPTLQTIIFLVVIDIMLYGSFENINKTRRSEWNKTRNWLKHRNITTWSLERHEDTDVYLFTYWCLTNLFLHFNEITLNLLRWHAPPWRHTLVCAFKKIAKEI